MISANAVGKNAVNSITINPYTTTISMGSEHTTLFHVQYTGAQCSVTTKYATYSPNSFATWIRIVLPQIEDFAEVVSSNCGALQLPLGGFSKYSITTNRPYSSCTFKSTYARGTMKHANGQFYVWLADEQSTDIHVYCDGTQLY